MLQFKDLLLTLTHLLIIGLNLLGWIFPATRKAHLVLICLTAGSWFILGIWYGYGYCPVTDWQWEVKTKLGETNLPASFIKYYADKITGSDIKPSIVDTATVVCFAVAAMMSVYVNFFRRKEIKMTGN